MIEVEMNAETRQKAVDSAVSDITKEFGKGTIVKMSDKVGQPMPCIPSGLYSLDYHILGIGGFPKGRIVEIFGPEGGGKTTATLQVIASVQRAGGLAAFVDMEHALDPNWAALNGANVDDMLISQPDHGEQALTITERLVSSAAFDVVVVDSVAALVPKSELEGEFGESQMGVQARMMSQALRKLTGVVSKSNTVLIFINQIREKLGVMFGSPETTTGGRALKFYSSVRLDVRKTSSIKQGEQIVGNKVRIKGSKNKVSAPFKEAEFDLLFDAGFDAAGDLVDAASAAGVIEKSGAWYSYKGERLGQGRANTVVAFKERNLYDEVAKQLREKNK